MNVTSGTVACTRYVGVDAQAQYDKYVEHGFALVMIDASDSGASAMVIMEGVAGRFDLAFDSRQEAAAFYLNARIGAQA